MISNVKALYVFFVFLISHPLVPVTSAFLEYLWKENVIIQSF